MAERNISRCLTTEFDSEPTEPFSFPDFVEAHRLIQDNATSRIFSNTPFQDENSAFPTWHIAYCGTKFVAKTEIVPNSGSEFARETEAVPKVERQHATVKYMDSHALPSILHLAQMAAKRARARVYVKEPTKDMQYPFCPYGLTPVHKELENELFFIS